MRNLKSIREIIFFSTIVILAFAVTAQAQEKKKLTFEQIFKGTEPKITASLPDIIGWADDDHYLESKKKTGEEKSKVYSVDAKSGKEKLYRDMDEYKQLVGPDIDPGSPASHTEAYDRLIYIKDKDLYFLDTKKKEFKRLTQTAAEEKNPTISPDGNYVAFTRDNNLFAIDIASGKEYQYTNDATDVVYNGWAAWVYYEEILGRGSRYRAFWWSPDSKTIAFYRFDETNVPMFPIYHSEGEHGTLEKTRYPEAGDPNPEVRVGFVPVTGGSVVWADFNQKDDQYFGTPFWTPDGNRLVVQWMNRGQDTLKLYSVDPYRGTKKEFYAEHQPSWVEWFGTVHFLNDNRGYILQSDKDGWSHLYRYGLDGTLVNQITQGKWAVTDVLCVDDDEQLVYFTAKKEASTNTDFYKVRFDGSHLTRLTSGDYTHHIQLSPHGKYFTDSYSNLAQPPSMALYTGEGRLVKELGDSKTKEFANYTLAKPELFRVTTPDGYALPVIWTLPTDFNANKKYPVLINIYGGPASPTVANSWRGIGEQWLAMEGVIQVTMDHRGSGHFGKEGVALMHRNLGKWEMNDYIEVAKWLRAKPFVDTTKICITGGSYGGYTTCMALTFGADYFTHGIASFSVTDWQLYDSHYTERYMDTPAENPEGYKNSSVMTYVDKYKGLLRIVHGTIDDNVHMQNSLQFVNALEDKGKHFEFMVYPGGRHGWGGPKATHSRNESYRFYYKYLLEKEFPEALFNQK